LAAERRLEKTVGRETIDWKWLVVGLAVYGSALLLGVPMGLGSFWVSLIFFAVLGLGAVPSKAVRWTLLALATLFSVWPADQGVHFTMDRKYYEEEPPLARQMVEPGRVYASFPEVIRFETVSGKSVGESYYRLKNAMVSNWPLAFGKEECYFYGSFFLSDYFKWCFSSTQFSNIISRKVLDYLNVRYVLGPHHFTNFRWLSTEKEPTPLSENLSPMPKWFSVSGAIPESSFDRDLWKVGNPGFHFSRQCFVENEDVCGPYSRRVVREIKRNSNGLTLEAHGTGKALLVSSEMAYPGWIATVEGRGVPLLKVNHGFRGVVLTDGEETVKMTFCPTPFRLGCFLSLLACALWAGMLFYQAGLRWRI
ncbi:MAG TPA: YfhO family protein, partial [bacterium]|nr:YfhO family protein [bacterium]